jgi:L-ascorbate metabolism protein UlaG (beta-lactamase superfamily)
MKLVGIWSLLAALAAVAFSPAARAQPGSASPTVAAGKTQITWYGHAAFRIQTPSGKVLLVDPWIDNPANKAGKEALANLGKVDLILVSHGHFDHVGNAVEIGKKNGAKLVTTFDLGKALVTTAGYPADLVGFDTQGNFGGALTLLDGEVTVAFVPAVHSSQVAKDDKSPGMDGGAPGGFVIMVKGGPTLYHTGDTDVFGDMALVGQFGKVDAMLACIGGHFTMGPARAAHAARLVKPATIVPMHYGTFPVLTGTVEQLTAELRKQGGKAKVRVPTIGEAFTL